MGEVIVRIVLPRDRETWARMRAELWPEVSGGDHELEMDAIAVGRSPVGFPGPSVAFLAVSVPDGGGDELGCGFLELAIRPWVEGCRGGPVGMIEGLWVEPRWRRMGVARRLLAAAEGYCREEGCVEMVSDAEPGNHASLAVHRELGFEERTRLVFLGKRLAPETAEGLPTAVATAGLGVLERAPVLDPAAFERLDRIGGAPLVRKIHKMFVERAPDLCRQAREALRAGDREELERLAHSLKSSAANIGAERLRRMAEDLEHQVASGDLESAPERLERVVEGVDQVLPEVDRIAG